MMKKEVLMVFSLVILMCFSSVVSAESSGGIEIQAHTAAVRWSDGQLVPTYNSTWQIYEFSNSDLVVWVRNTDTSLDKVNDEKINYFGLNNLSSSNILSGNLVSVDNSLIIFNDTINKDGSQEYRINSTAISVLQDTNQTWVINLTDENGNKSSHTLVLTVLNDSLAPRIDWVYPTNHKIVKNETFNVLLNYTESESGFNSSEFLYRDDPIYVSGVGSVNGTIAGNCSSNQCSFSFDPNARMSLNDGFFYMDGYFKVNDKAGNVNNSYLYHLYVDNQKPVVVLNSPADGAITRQSTANFDYNMSDNSFGISGGSFNPSVNCSLYLNNDSEIYVASKVNNSNVTNSIITADLSTVNDGIYTWYFKCVDSAGWAQQSSTRNISIDKHGPIISMTSHNNGAVINNNTNITFSVTDAPADVDSIWWISGANNNSFPGSGSGTYVLNSGSLLADLNNLQMYANDTVNNINNTNFTIYVDNKGPSISLISPADNAFGSGTFTATVIDDYSSNLICTLNEGNASDIQIVINGTTGNFSVIGLADGTYPWNVTCTDEVGNSNTSLTWTVKIDTTDPAVTLVSPDGTNNTNGTVDFYYNFNEPNLKNCSLYVNETHKANNSDGSNFTSITIGASNDAQAWYVKCYDQAGNNNQSSSLNVYFDNSPPVISGVTNSSITSSSVIVSWTVNEVANNTVYYGTNSSNLDLSETGTSTSASPSIDLGGLSSSTIYYFKVGSCDRWNLCANDTIYNFTTSAASFGASSSGGGSSKAQCEDKKDNDGDGLIDLADPGCANSEDNDETNSKGSSCEEKWTCGDWSECTNSQQTRTCTDANNCGSTFFKPETEQTCVMPSSEPAVNPEDTFEVTPPSTPPGIGQATGLFNRIKANWYYVAGALAVLGALGLMGWRRGMFKKRGKKDGSGAIFQD